MERRFAKPSLVLGVMALALSGTACPNQVETSDPTGGGGTSSNTGTTTTITDDPPIEKASSLDIVLAIDNSRDMGEKQVLLSLAVSDLVAGLVNPGCVDSNGNYVATPPGPLDPCPEGSQREHEPVLDIHLGVVTSSLGGHGSDACPTIDPELQSNNDRGRLIARLDPSLPGEVETYQNLKFLAWDPSQELQPPGEADLDVDSATDAGGTALVPTLRDMVIGAGQIGCGFESQLESWYRFLIDPTPPENVTLDANKSVLLEGLDEALLAQRKSFLRPDSVLAIVMLSDENDCSIKESKQFYYAAQIQGGGGQPFHLPKARADCETDPGGECCYSCGQKGPTDNNGNPVCPNDPSCKTADGKFVYLDDLSDNINVRCFDQKRRFGIDFLYPVSRYSDALSALSVTDRNGQVVPNPIFSDLDPSDDRTAIRSSSSVVLAALVGVPWQDIARTNANGVPDVNSGLDADGKPQGGFRSAAEMAEILPGKDYTTWDMIAGDVDAFVPPKDPLMIESIETRNGTHPITGDPIVPSVQPLANEINGHEYVIPYRDDLQYACIFPLVEVDGAGNVTPAVRDCSAITFEACECSDEDNDNPVCAINPATGAPTNQVSGKAYPGVRQLSVLSRIGNRAVAGSVCPVQVTNKDGKDFGYRPSIRAILHRLQQHF